MLKSAFTNGILSTSSGNGRCFTLYLSPTSFLGAGRGSGANVCNKEIMKKKCVRLIVKFHVKYFISYISVPTQHWDTLFKDALKQCFPSYVSESTNRLQENLWWAVKNFCIKILQFAEKLPQKEIQIERPHGWNVKPWFVVIFIPPN